MIAPETGAGFIDDSRDAAALMLAQLDDDAQAVQAIMRTASHSGIIMVLSAVIVAKLGDQQAREYFTWLRDESSRQEGRGCG